MTNGVVEPPAEVVTKMSTRNKRNNSNEGEAADGSSITAADSDSNSSGKVIDKTIKAAKLSSSFGLAKPEKTNGKFSTLYTFPMYEKTCDIIYLYIVVLHVILPHSGSVL